MQVNTMAADDFSCNEHLQASTLITQNKDKPSNRAEWAANTVGEE
jgi:hypothetical protein